jgi:sphinganine-1-phosphate aldolase
MNDAGYTIAPFDFRVTGVTSISCDTHKYGFAPKGSSVVMYRTPELRRFAYFAQPDWPGGIYATPTVTGSRNGASLVGCWAILMFMGRNGYIHSTREIVSKQRQMTRAIRDIPELKVIGEPLASVFAFTSSKIDIYRVSELLGRRGWALSPCQFPPAIHFTVTTLSDADLFIKDLNEVMDEVRKSPGTKAGGSAAIYGLSATIADRSLVDRFARGYCDALFITHDKKAHPTEALSGSHGSGASPQTASSSSSPKSEHKPTASPKVETKK